LNKSIRIGKRSIGKYQPVFMIAEAGVNHNGSLKLAKTMIDRAKEAGADAVKFQTFKAEELATREAPKAAYQKRNLPGGSQFDLLRSLQLSENNFRELSAYCAKKGIIFLSTPFEEASADFLNKLKIPAYKISSGDLTNFPLLRKVAGFKRPVILSTGMGSLAEVKEAVRVIHSAGDRDIILLHCTSNYPADFADVNLNAMLTLANEFNLMVGYSDHTPGIEVPIAAAALGARVIEKHFTLDKELPGPDQRASLDPAELRNMVRAIRNIEQAMGDGIKAPRRSEEAIKMVARKSIVARRAIPCGARLTLDMLAVKRPGTGIAPAFLKDLIKMRTKVAMRKDQIIGWDQVRRK